MVRSILPPWISTKKRPPKGEEFIFMDENGGYHLAKYNGQYVCPVIYGNAPNVERNLSEFVCYTPIIAPQVA
jgi:hypothetical protein